MNVGEPLEIDTLLLRFLRTSYNRVSWGCPGILKSRSGMDMISNRWESIISLFRNCIPIGSRDISIKKRWNVTFSGFVWLLCFQGLPFFYIMRFYIFLNSQFFLPISLFIFRFSISFIFSGFTIFSIFSSFLYFLYFYGFHAFYISNFLYLLL